MKVMLIDVNFKYSSTGKIVYDIYNYLKSNGDEAVVCYGRGKKENEENVFKFSYDFETTLHAFLTRVAGLMGYYSLFSTMKLKHYIRKNKPDIVHIHELHSYFVNVNQILKYINKIGIPIVHTYHCEFMYTGKCGYSGNCSKWKTECSKCPSRDKYPKSYVDRTKKMFNDKKKTIENMRNYTITTPSKWLADRVAQSFCKSHEIKVIHNGVDTSVFKKTDYSSILKDEYNNKKIILSVAPNIMDDRKGGKLVVELSKLFENYQDYHFILIGCTKKDMMEYYENVTFLPIINNQNILAMYYSLASIFVLPSKYETFSMTCAEAISCGTKVIGFKCGAPESVFDKSEATFVDYGDLESLKKQILKTDYIMNDTTHRYSKTKMCLEYRQLYVEKIGK